MLGGRRFARRSSPMPKLLVAMLLSGTVRAQASGMKFLFVAHHFTFLCIKLRKFTDVYYCSVTHIQL